MEEKVCPNQALPPDSSAVGRIPGDGTKARRIVDLCLDHGLNLFDTADIYSRGGSEEVLGAAIKGRRDKVLVSSVPQIEGLTIADLRERKVLEAYSMATLFRGYEVILKGRDPRDAIAKLGAESMAEGIDRDMGAKHAKWFVISAKTTGWLRETELVPKTQGVVASIKQIKFAMNLARHGKVPPPFPPHVADRVDEARALYDLVKQQGRDGARGIVQGERGLGLIEFAEEQEKREKEGHG